LPKKQDCAILNFVLIFINFIINLIRGMG